MVKFKYLVPTFLLIGISFLCNVKLGSIPPLGSFLNPFTGFFQNAENGTIAPKISLKLDGVQNSVEIYIDSFNIPHIFAQNEVDLYYAQGYLVASQRLWQMDLQTTVAAGELSEIIGEKTLNLDRTNRRIGLKYAAENGLPEMMKGSTGVALENFSRGVNDYIATLNSKSLPLEYKLLDYKPKAWSPLRTVLLLKMMANNLCTIDYDIFNTNLLKVIGKDDFNMLYPDFVDGQTPIVPNGTKYGFTAQQEDTISQDFSIANITVKNIPFEKPERHLGSNNWVINGQKSATGNPVLCNDPHLTVSLPSIWYQMQLVCPTVNVYGVTIPGAPGVIIGFNKEIAWGVTNAERDVQNWYHIQFKDDSRKEYKYADGWKKTTQRIEKIVVRGKDIVYDTVLYTHHGPVVFDSHFNTKKDRLNLALSWTTYFSSNELQTFYSLNRAKNFDDYRSAIKHYNCPGQNFVFASNTGDIAITHEGLFPISKNHTDKFVLDGSDKSNDFTRFIPKDKNPFIKNPEKGYLYSANQHPTDSTYPYTYNSGDFDYYRARRIEQVLASKQKVAIHDLMKLHGDNMNLYAAETLPTLLKGIEQTISKSTNKKEQEYFKELSVWNFENNAESKAAALFQNWWEKIQKNTWDELHKDSLEIGEPDQYILSRLIRTNPQSKYFDILNTPKQETAQDIMLTTYKEMVKEFSENNIKTWSEYKATELNHLAKIDAFSHKNVPIGGNKNIVNACGKTWGPSWRMIVEVTPNGPKAYGIYPGGQSGNPGSASFDNYIDKWVHTEYNPLVYAKNIQEISSISISQISIEPKKK